MFKNIFVIKYLYKTVHLHQILVYKYSCKNRQCLVQSAFSSHGLESVEHSSISDVMSKSENVLFSTNCNILTFASHYVCLFSTIVSNCEQIVKGNHQQQEQELPQQRPKIYFARSTYMGRLGNCFCDCASLCLLTPSQPVK